MSKEELKQQFEAVAAGYVALFLDRYFDGLETEHYWTADRVGSVLAVNDFFFDYDDIRYAIDNDLDFDRLYNWYNYSVAVYELTDGDMNVRLSSFVAEKLPYDTEKIADLITQKRNLDRKHSLFLDKLDKLLKGWR